MNYELHQDPNAPATSNLSCSNIHELKIENAMNERRKSVAILSILCLFIF